METSKQPEKLLHYSRTRQSKGSSTTGPFHCFLWAFSLSSFTARALIFGCLCSFWRLRHWKIKQVFSTFTGPQSTHTVFLSTRLALEKNLRIAFTFATLWFGWMVAGKGQKGCTSSEGRVHDSKAVSRAMRMPRANIISMPLWPGQGSNVTFKWYKGYP